jgi:hypothetical protein
MAAQLTRTRAGKPPLPFKNMLDQIRANPDQHNRWKRLATYTSRNTAKVTASKLRHRPDTEGFVFQVLPFDDGHAIGVMYKRTGPDGRIPPRPDCPHCHDTGQIQDGTLTVPCTCQTD